ncbi:MAG: DNA replication/repair protein RecF [Pseudomonadota bacterium]
MIRVSRLQIDGVRNLSAVDLKPGPGINLFLGGNGAGKTSLLEALHCLSRGRSFLGSGRHEFLNREQRKAIIVAHLTQNEESAEVLGIQREPSTWSARAGGADIKSLATLAEKLPFSVFHPGLHRLVEGQPEDRRRFLDFGVFHVEHHFLDQWRRYRTTLRQRNAAIRSGASLGEITIWDRALTDHGEAVTQFRLDHLERIKEFAGKHLQVFSPSLGKISLSLAKGWPEDQTLDEALDESLSQDRDLGFTGRGPHRGDVRLVLSGQRVAGRLSRGQQKMVALALLLAQAEAMSEAGEVPVIGFDDLPSELDAEHQRLAVDVVRELGAQTWITGNASPPGVDQGGVDKVFHVEQGRVSELV